MLGEDNNGGFSDTDSSGRDRDIGSTSHDSNRPTPEEVKSRKQKERRKQSPSEIFHINVDNPAMLFVSCQRSKCACKPL